MAPNWQEGNVSPQGNEQAQEYIQRTQCQCDAEAWVPDRMLRSCEQSTGACASGAVPGPLFLGKLYGAPNTSERASERAHSCSQASPRLYSHLFLGWRSQKGEQKQCELCGLQTPIPQASSSALETAQALLSSAVTPSPQAAVLYYVESLLCLCCALG